MGTIYNLGCYPVSLLHLVMTTVYGREQFDDRSMTAVGNLAEPVEQTDGHGAGTIGDAAMAVKFGNGVLATIQSTDNFGNDSDFAIVGDRGTLRFDTNPWLPEAGENVLTWTPFVDDGSSPATERIVINDEHDAFYHQIKLVERCVADGLLEAPRPSPNLDDSRQIMAMLTEWEERCWADDSQFGEI
jgi:predicted dehydrogenase